MSSSPPDAAPPPPAPPDAAPAPAPPDAAPAPAPKTATLALDTTPSGASVFDDAGKQLGKTPFKLVVPADGKDLHLVFKRAGMKDKPKTVAATGDRSITIDLEPVETQAPHAGSGSATPANGSGHGSGSGHHGHGHGGHGSGSGTGSDLMAPDF
jgi:hypothetical protein